jgi:hypothetical protein
VAPLLARFVLVKMDLTDRSQANPARAVAMKFAVRNIPDMRVLAPEGKQLGVIDSSDVDDLIAQLRLFS